MMKRYIQIAFIFLFNILWSQVNLSKSPEANTITKFDAIPTGDYTGSKSFEIPIYTIKDGDLSVPISLKYHASGVMIEDVSGKFGLGWILNIGGINFSYQKYGKEDTNIWVPTTQDLGELNIANSSSNQFAFNNTSSIYPEDSQPDIFSYSTLRGTGKFILDHKKPLYFPPSKIILDSMFLNNAFKYPSGVKNLTPKVLDIDGTEYFFDNPITTYGSIGDGSPLGGLYSSINWEIGKIKLLNNNEINFTYQSNNYDYISGVNRKLEISPYSVYYTDPYCLGNSGLSEQVSISSVNDKILKQIDFPQGKVEFIYNDKINEPREDITKNVFLKEVKIYDKASRLIKTISLNYSYLISDDVLPTLPTPLTEDDKKQIQKRLVLNTVTDSQSGKYTLDYYNNGFVPNRLSFSKDYWGFYNGKFNSTDIPKTIIFGTQYSDANRNADISYAKQFSVKSLKYPTGGKHIIDYELNDYYVNGKITKDTVFVHTIENDEGFTGMSKVFNFNVVQTGIYQILFGAASPPMNSNPDQIIQGENYAVYLAELYKDNQLILTTTSPYDYFEKDLFQGNYSLKIYKTIHYNETPNHHFEFTITGQQTYEEPFAGNINAGGLRVNSYKIYDNSQLVKNYFYKYNIPGTNKSSGISYPLFLSSILVSTNPKVQKNLAVDGEVTPNYLASCLRYTVSNNNNGINLNLIGRSSVGYSFVTEFIQSTDNKQFSIIRKYINHNIDNDLLETDPDELVDIPVFSMIYEFGKPQFVPLENGNILKETFKDENGNTVREDTFEYDLDNYFNNQSTNIDLGDRYLFSGWLFSRSKHIIMLGTVLTSNTSGNNPATELYDAWHTFKYNSARYLIPSNWTKLSTKTTKEFFGNKILETKTSYNYNLNYKHLNPTKNSVILPDTSVSETTYHYAHEKGNTKLINANIIAIPLEVSVTEKENALAAGTLISKSETKYDDASHLFPSSAISYNLQSGNASTQVTFNQYDTKGNILQYTTKDGMPISIIWGYNKTQPIAKIEGAIYDNIKNNSLITAIISASDSDAADPSAEGSLIAALDALRNDINFKNFQMATITYDPLIGVTTLTPPSGIREIYKYDYANRLEKIVDEEGKILKEYQYNYKP